MSPNLNSDHHIIFQFPDSWIRKAQEIRGKEDFIPGKQVFDSDNRWVGKIGEWAFYSVYKFKAVTQHFNPSKYDFQSDRGLRYEVKTNVSNYPFKDNFEFNINDRQFQKNDNDVYVICHYFLNSPFIRLCGWIYKRMVKTRGRLLRKGEQYSSKFPVRADQWSIPYRELNSMHLLPG